MGGSELNRDRLLRTAVGLTAGICLVGSFWWLRLYDGSDDVAVYAGDLYQQIYPMWVRAGAWMREGTLPLWNPYQLLGHPFHASLLYGVFYPPNLLRVVLPAHVALELTMVIHLLLAWAFTFAFARVLGLGRLPAYGAATVFCLAGNMVQNAIWFLPAFEAITWIPMGLLAVELIVRRGRWRWCALLAVAITMPILAGWMQEWLHLVHAVAIYSLVRLSAMALDPEQRSRLPRVVALLAIGAALGIAAASIQLLPTYELQEQGWRRSGGLTLRETMPTGVKPPRAWLADLINATPGHPRYGYVGVVSVVLLPLSLLAANRSPLIGMWMIGVWGVSVAMTFATPAFAIYRMLPGGTLFRAPWRIIVLGSTAAALLTGFALEAVMVGARTRVALAAAASSLLAVACWWFEAPPRSMILVSSSLIAVWCAVVSPPRWRGLIGLILAAMLTWDLFLSVQVQGPRPFQNLAILDRESDALEYVRTHQGLDRTFLFHPTPFTPAVIAKNVPVMAKQGTLRGIYMVTDYEVLSLDRHARFYAAAESSRLTKPGPFLGLLNLSTPSRTGVRLLDMMSVRFLVAPKRTNSVLAFKDLGWIRVGPMLNGDYMVLENPRPLPRAYVAYNSAFVPGGEAELELLLKPLFDPWTTVGLQKEDRSRVSPSFLPGRQVTPATITSYEPTRVMIEYQTSAPGVLVLTDSAYPGWKAYLDGVERPILRANYLFRGVATPPGAHRVEFRFEPTVFRVGAWLTLLSCAIGLALVALDRRGSSAA